ncbi:probable lysophospholipase BODYGUARD 4 isoform X2 [Macadamia integrifolia]|uniref:probable lysophospholipase BODYGUARD 4 isoform X2 n=1 Tax=Macadamia integrifolia TaxID=60698 RepID=UPI001C52DD9B|nr:probable lysophospholipase BODYGUARD 4 isoform X2 [Macadamia integrifolia]
MQRMTFGFAHKWPQEAVRSLTSTIGLIVFTLLDLLDFFLCIFYSFIDGFLEVDTSSCYCHNRGEQRTNIDGRDKEAEISETLYRRKNIFRDLGLPILRAKRDDSIKRGSLVGNRWSDCNCESCVSWQLNGDQKLHVVVSEPSPVANEDCKGKPTENVIFLHGFLSSSSLWTDVVFPNLSEPAKQSYRLFAVDLLGFGRSPKPRDCLYTLKDHMEMIEKSVIDRFQLNSFHLVAHSMGCIIVLALAAKYSKSLKSITLIAPPYFPSSDDNVSLTALNRLAERKLWPPLLFGSSVMSWYEHVGRSICFILCRNHQMWEWILKLLTRRDLHFMAVDLTKHTHHSAWHTMHNVICGGAKLMDEYLEVLNKSGVSITIIQGDKDQVVPFECSHNMKLKVPLAEVKTISNANHTTVIMGREKEFMRDLEQIWCFSGK